ncbi:hypothetical protein H8D57_00815 [bacterium]|nr:hypothetical protein [bacterium]
MHHIADPDEMTSSELFHEVADILAAGFLRLRKQSSKTVIDADSPTDSTLTGLSEVPAVNRIAPV